MAGQFVVESARRERVGRGVLEVRAHFASVRALALFVTAQGKAPAQATA